MASIQPKICLFCQRPFTANPRTAHQRICSKESCQKERKRRKWRRWTARHKEIKKQKLRQWAKAYPNYWQDYRKNKNPAYTARDNKRRCQAAPRLRRRSAKQTLIRLCAERINAIRGRVGACDCSAKQTLIEQKLEGIWGYLWWRDCSAKQTYMALSGPAGG